MKPIDRVLIVGGGIGGLSCAARLAEHGLAVLLHEARSVAGGASGRNGGFLLAGSEMHKLAAAKH